MANNVQVSLSFTADTAKARAQLQELQTSLNNLMKASPTSLHSDFGTEQIVKAQQAAAKLQIALKDATNVNTGKLNLTQFNASLQKSGMSLKDFRIQLQALGPQGEKTFLNLAKSIMSADIALKNTNKLLDSFWNALKQTAKYQISASVFRGFTSGITSAINYAEDLNKSLTKIQIVTNKTTEDMARFARQANKAAKELSTTTTGYTDASLIYFQQGLSDAEVKARTDITIKAANAAGTQTAEMADYLTAVWNSYKVGAEDLERYTDIMAALGAGTATSLEEISTAMEKVASVGEATGVKFEQLSSIIATVSSVTRTSAESVGTAYKTIFARMADLKLEGSVEEDGVTTTLGTVSEQLAQVGVNILDANGDLREMGSVLEELMGKWNNMNGATQQAVAIALAGKRQYTQLLALMNNQDMYFDAMSMAENSEGTVDQQAEIYAKSWEAAQKRVKAAAQGIYDSLLNDQFFIMMNNLLADTLGLVEKLVDGMGGFAGVLGIVGVSLTKVFSSQLKDSLSKSFESIYSFTETGKQEAKRQKEEAYNETIKMLEKTSAGSNVTTEEVDIIKKRMEAYRTLINQAEQMSDLELKQYQLALDITQAYEDRVVAAADAKRAAEAEASAAEGQLFATARNAQGTNEKEILKRANDFRKQAWKRDFQGVVTFGDGSEEDDIQVFEKTLSRVVPTSKAAEKELKILKQELENIKKQFSDIENEKTQFDKTKSQLNRKEKRAKQSQIANQEKNALKNYENLTSIVIDLQSEYRNADEELRALTATTENGARIVENFEESIISEQRATEGFKTTVEELDKAQEEAFNQSPSKNTLFEELAESSTQALTGISSLVFGFSSLTSIWDTLNNDDMGFFEKFITISGQVFGAIQGIGGGLKDLKEGWNTLIPVIEAYNAARKKATIEDGAEASANVLVTTTQIAENKEKQKEVNLDNEAGNASKNAAKGDALEAAGNVAEMGSKVGGEAIKTGGKAIGLGQGISAIGKALSSLLPTLAAALPWIIGIGSAVAIGIIAWKEYKKQLPEEQLKKASEVADNLDSALQRTTESAEAFSKAVKGWNEAKDALGGLTKGTKEYEEALKKANEEAKKLIETYGLWDNYTIDVKTGAYEIDEEVLKNIQDQKDQQINDLKESSTLASINVSRLKAETEAKPLKNKMYNLTSNPDSYDDSGTIYSNQTQDLINKLANSDAILSQEMTDEALIEVIDSLDGLSGSVTQNKELFVSYKEDLLKAVEAQRSYNDVLIQKTKQLLELDIDENYTDNLEKSFGKSITEGQKAAAIAIMASSSQERLDMNSNIKTALDEAKINTLSKRDRNSLEVAKQYGGKMTYEELTKEYAKLQGIENVDDLLFTNEKGRGTLKDSTGKEVVIDAVLYDDMVQALKTNEITNEIMSKANEKDALDREKQAQALGDITIALNNLGDGFGDAALEALANKSEKMDLSSTFGNIYSQEEVDQLYNLSSDELLEKLGLTRQQIQDAGYKSAEEFELAFDKGLSEWDYSKHKEMAFSSLSSEAKKYELDEDVLRTQAELLLKNEKGLQGNAKQAAALAVANQRLNKGVDNLTDNWEDWKKTLETTEKTSQDYAEALVGMQNSLRDILGLSEEQIIPADFFEIPENVDLLGEIADGSEAAVQKIGYNLAIAQVQSQEFSEDVRNALRATTFTEADVSAEFIEEQLPKVFNNIKNNLITQISEIQAAFDGVDPGTSLTGEKAVNFANALNEYAKATGMTVEQMNGYLSEMGVEAHVVTDTTNIQTKVPIYETVEQVSSGGTVEVDNGDGTTRREPIIKKRSYTNIVGYKPVIQTVEVAQINMGEGKGGPTFTHIGKGNISPSATSKGKKSGGGGGGRGGGGKSSKPKTTKEQKTDKKKFEDEHTRYRDSDALLAKQERLLGNIQRQKDVVYGAKYLKFIDAENEALERTNELLAEQMNEAKDYMSLDLNTLTANGINVEIDKDGFITNAEDIERQLVEMANREITRWDNEINSINKDYDSQVNSASDDDKDGIEDNRTKALDDAAETHKNEEERIESVKKAFESYEEAVNKYYDNAEQREEKLAKIRTNNYEKITYKLEKLLQITENENKLIEAQSALLEESFKNAPELFDNNLKTTENMLDDLDHYRNLYKEIQSLSSEELTDTDRMDGIQQAFDGILDTVSSLTEQADYFKNAYSEALGQVQEEAEKLYSQFDHFISLTENYENILGLLNRSTDYETLNNILKARQQLQQDQYQASKEDYEMLLGQIAQARQAQAAALGRGDQAAADVYKNTIESLTVAVHEAQATMIDNVQAWLEGIAKVRDTAIAAARQVLENSLTNGSTFNEFNQELEYLQAKQEDYLTETNQQYETQKLIRTAMLDIEKTENQVAKNKLNAYIKETEELQKQERLSNFELEVQQAKYDLLLAEIALQEAQDAKSQVRLQRDSEGNFNYVYTADQNKIAEAESKYADAENNLYNIRLEGANEYAQKYYELMQEMADKMAEIQADETLSTEEKNRRMEELYSQYYSRLKDMQSIYNIAAIGLDDDLNEAVSANMMDNIASLSDFKEATQQYLSDCETAQNEWQDNADTVSGLVSGDFQAVKEKSGELKKGIEDLRKDSEYNLNSIQSKTQSWAETMAGHLQSVKSEAMLLANAFQTVLAAASGFSNTNYMAEYDSATNVIDAFSSLNARDFKIANDKELADQYGTTAKALMESDRDQSNQIQNASSKTEAIAAAARREAKLEYLKRHDTELYNQLIKGFKTEDLLTNEAINISQEEAKQLVAEMRRQLQYFDTGGYTGEFGPEGRLAMLHQKEIVLNSQDTANLLDTVDIVRKLIDNIEYKALMSSFGSINIPSSFGNTNKDVVEQEVTIHAEFPNVQHSNEIEEAFNNLINTASQYANRKSY